MEQEKIITYIQVKNIYTKKNFLIDCDDIAAFSYQGETQLLDGTSAPMCLITFKDNPVPIQVLSDQEMLDKWNNYNKGNSTEGVSPS